MDERDLVAAAVGIMKNGVIIHDEVFGWMDKQRTVPLPDNVMMRLASVTKPITAAAIHALHVRPWKGAPPGSPGTLRDRVMPGAAPTRRRGRVA